MADSENIGDLNVSIGADYSPLRAAIDGAKPIAQQGGKEISDALAAGGAAGENLGAIISEQLSLIGPAASSAAASIDPFDAAVVESATDSAMLANNVAEAAAALSGMAGPAQESGQQLNLFADALEGIPWADASGQLNLFTDELEPLASGLGTASQAAQTFASSETDVASAAEAMNPQVKESGITLQDLARQLVAVGSAMIIVSKIEDLASAALEASDNVTRATIALTALTGDAQRAGDEVAKLEALGVSDGLSMPELLTAAARMQALLGATAQVPALLAQLANSAAVSGQGIDSAANAFDRIVTSGTVAARSLVPLGINLQNLAAAFNDVTGTAIATESNVASLMKQLGDTERVVVLQDALKKLDGIAQSVRDNTFGGAWASLVAEWSQVLKDAGEALLPVIKDLTDFTKTDILPFLKDAIDLFKALPEPVKDGAVLLGVAATAALGLASALGTLGIALGGVESLLGTFGITFGGAAASATTAGTALVGAGEAATGAAAAMGTLVAGGVAIAAELAILGKATYDWLSATGQANQAQRDLEAQTNSAAAALKAHGVAVDDLVNAYKAGNLSLDDYNQRIRDLLSASSGATFAVTATGKAVDLTADAIKKITDATSLNVTGLGTAVDGYNKLNAMLGQGKASATEVTQALAAVNEEFAKLPGTMEPVSLALANASQAAHDAGNAYQTASGVFQATLASFHAGVATIGQLTTAQDALTKSEQAAAAAGIPIPGSLQAIDEAARGAVESMTGLATSQQLASDKTMAQQDAVRDLSQDVIVASQKLDLLTQEQQKAQRAADSNTGSMQQLRTVTQAVVAAASDLQAKQDALATAELRASNAAADAGGNIGLLKQAQNEANLSLDQAKTKFDTATTSTNAYMSAQKAARDAAVALGVAAAEQAADVNRSTSGVDLAAAAAAGAAAKLKILTQAFKDNNASIADVAGATSAYVSAEVDAAKSAAANASGLQGLTDDYSLNKVAVVESQAQLTKLQDLYRSGFATYDQVISAESDLAAKQKALNDVTQQGNPLVVALDGAYGHLGGVMGDLGPQVDAVTASLKQNLATLNDVAEAVTSIEDDMKAAFGGMQGGSASAPAGYKWQTFTVGTPGLGGHQYVELVPLPETSYNQAIAAANALVPDKGTDAQSLANDVLAQAKAVLAIDQQYYGQQGSTGAPIVTAQALQAALQAVASAQAALASLTGQSAGSNANLRLDPTQTAPSLPGTTTADGSTTVPGVTTGSTTAAIDGGIYPSVTAHQATGEIWQVTVAGQFSASGGTSASAAAAAVADASSGSTPLSGAVGAVAGAVQQLSTTFQPGGFLYAGLSAALLPISDSLRDAANSIAAVAAVVSKAVPGGIINVTGGGSTSAPVTGGGGTGYPTGNSSSYGSGNPQGNAANTPPPATNVPGYNPFGGGATSVPTVPTASGNTSSIQITANVAIDNRGNGSNAAQMQKAASQGVMQGMVDLLRTSGARL